MIFYTLNSPGNKHKLIKLETEKTSIPVSLKLNILKASYINHKYLYKLILALKYHQIPNCNKT